MKRMRNILVTISGNIGAGKTTLLQRYRDYKKSLNDGEDVVIVFEKVEENELLRLMYEDPKRWTFTSQVNFMIHKFNVYKEASRIRRSQDSIILVERDFEDFLVFARVQRYAGYLTESEYRVYLDLYETMYNDLKETLSSRGIVLKRYYLDVPLDVALCRIQERGREFEISNITPGYLYALAYHYRVSVNTSGNFDILPPDYSVDSLDSYFHSWSSPEYKLVFPRYKVVSPKISEEG